jgi:hypothetical protein
MTYLQTETTADPGGVWPIRTLQSSLLNIIFAFESGVRFFSWPEDTV